MQLEAVLWWQNHFSITLSQLLEHRYHVMHIRLPDKHNVVNHFCLLAFLSEQIFPSLSRFYVFTACMQLEAVLWWQNHFSITLSQLLEHRYHVMHIRLPDKHNVVNHFCLLAFLSEQIFPSLSMSCCSFSSVIFQG